MCFAARKTTQPPQSTHLTSIFAIHRKPLVAASMSSDHPTPVASSTPGGGGGGGSSFCFATIRVAVGAAVSQPLNRSSSRETLQWRLYPLSALPSPKGCVVQRISEKLRMEAPDCGRADQRDLRPLLMDGTAAGKALSAAYRHSITRHCFSSHAYLSLLG